MPAVVFKFSLLPGIGSSFTNYKPEPPNSLEWILSVSKGVNRPHIGQETIYGNKKGATLFLGDARYPARPQYQRTMTSLCISLRITMTRMMRIASPMRTPIPSSAPAPARSVRDAIRCKSCALIAWTLAFASAGDTP